MKHQNLACVVALFAAPSIALAGLSEVVSIGKGRYMIGGTSATVYGNVAKLQVKAMGLANKHCTDKRPGSEAVVEDLDAQKANSGWGGGGGFGTNQAWGMGGGANRAEIQIVFTCQAPEAEVTPAPAPMQAQEQDAAAVKAPTQAAAAAQPL